MLLTAVSQYTDTVSQQYLSGLNNSITRVSGGNLSVVLQRVEEVLQRVEEVLQHVEEVFPRRQSGSD